MSVWLARPFVALTVGAFLALLTMALVVSDSSRAAASWVGPLAIALVLVGAFGRVRPDRAPRWVQVVVFMGVFVLVTMGIWVVVSRALLGTTPS